MKFDNIGKDKKGIWIESNGERFYTDIELSTVDKVGKNKTGVWVRYIGDKYNLYLG